MNGGQRFHLGDLLSVTDGHLVSPSHMDGVHRIIDYVTGVPHFTHQLPRGAEVVKPWLLEQHPWLAGITVPDDLRGNADVDEFLESVVSQYGEFHDVTPLPFGAYVGREPIAELEEMVGSDRVTVPDATTQAKLDDALRCVASGIVIRTRSPYGGWDLYVGDQQIADGETALAVSILEAQGFITWWPKHSATQKAGPTLDKGLEAFYRITTHDLDGDAA